MVKRKKMLSRNSTAMPLSWFVVSVSAVERWVSLNKKHGAETEIMSAFLFSVCTQSAHPLPFAANQQQKGISTVSLSIFVFIMSHITIATFITGVSLTACFLIALSPGLNERYSNLQRKLKLLVTFCLCSRLYFRFVTDCVVDGVNFSQH